MADSVCAKLKALDVADSHFSDVQKEMGAKGDIAGIYGAVRKESGLPFANQK